jgi:hypothetical protein
MAVQLPDAANPVTSEAVLYSIGRYASAAIDIGSLAISTITSGAGCCGRDRINY